MPKKRDTVIYDTDGRRTKKLYSYAVLLTEKDGSEVKAMRFDGYERKTDVMHEIPDGWNLKAIQKLYDEDFEA